jgi:competence protein ComFC
MRALKALLQNAVNTTLGLFYPEICALCQDEAAAALDGYVGAKCRSLVRWVRPPFCQRCGLPFAGDITTLFECTNCRDMDLHFSYARALWFENFLAGLLLAEAIPVLRGQRWDFIVPVPLHPLKEREREFNQAELLAVRLSKATGIALNAGLLHRVKSTATQTLLWRPERATNMRGAFAVKDGVKLDDKKVIVVDDVFTTGATTNDCARALRGAGAVDVCVWTMARGL